MIVSGYILLISRAVLGSEVMWLPVYFTRAAEVTSFTARLGAVVAPEAAAAAASIDQQIHTLVGDLPV